jgi:hypothetical protein
VQPAPSLSDRTVCNEHKRLTIFLHKDNERSLVSILRAFDATPTNRTHNYDLRIIMRYSGRTIPDHVAAGYHSDHVQPIGEDFSSLDIHKVASDSSAMSVADPTFDSRAYATAVDAGVASVVLAGDMVTDAVRGYAVRPYWPKSSATRRSSWRIIMPIVSPSFASLVLTHRLNSR